MKLVLVTWLDAQKMSDEDEVTPEGPIGAVRETAGWLLRRDEEGVVIAMSKDNHSDRTAFSRGFAIPKTYIKRVEVLGGDR